MRRGPFTSLIVIVVVAVAAMGGTLAAGYSPQLGLDLQGGASVVLRPQKKTSSGALNQAIQIIRNRVDGLGVAEPEISRQGSNIIVQLPGVKDQKRALELVGQTAELRFRPVIEAVPLSETETPTTTTTVAGATTTAPGATTTTAASASPTTAAPATLRAAGQAQAATTTTAAPAPTAPATTAPAATPTSAPTASTEPIPTTSRADDKADQVVVLPLKEGGRVTARYRLGPSELSGKAVKTARAQFDQTGSSWQVDFTLTGSGSKDFDALAARNVGKQVAIVLDGVVKSAPTIQQAEFKGRGQITGSFSEKEAKDLALVLRYGALPVELKPETVQTVSASLGKDSLHAGVLAGLLGLGLVLLYMILYYRALGLVVFLGLSVSGMLMWSVVSFLGERSGLALSLAGAVGIIVSVGVTVDSYVVYFERLKDEIRAGKTIRSSVDRGFARAYRTILAADTASLIGAGLLYFLTVGSVRGFAFFLGLSTLLDMVIAYTFTRPLVILLGRNRMFTEARWLGVARGLAAPAPVRAAS
ncbi:MAG TPA: protein translocase subunit SecD [Acidimicrobiales bacterium]|nr:protein translocase subunit SecD [Acidimicrobiales bacterium]